MSPKRRSRKNRDLPPNLGHETKGGVIYYYYRHPYTKAKTYWGPVDRKKAIAAAIQLNIKIYESDNLIDSVINNPNGKDRTFAHVIKRFKEEFLPRQKYEPDTLLDKGYKLDRIKADLGQRDMQTYTLEELAEYLDKNFTKNPYIKHRQVMVDLYQFAKRKGIYTKPDNPARETEPSKKDDEKVRQRLTPEGYQAIYNFEETPQWMKDAMDLALITLQGRAEICKARFDDESEGFFHVVRQKTKKKTDRAFIRIEIDEHLKRIIKRCRTRDDYISPYLISRQPERKNKGYMNNRDHWTQILPNNFGQHFQKLRDGCGFFDDMEKPERPTFHEIRSLGGDLYVQAGYSEEHVNLLYGHTTLKTTKIYLKGHRQEWSECSLGLDLNKALEQK